MIPRVCHIFISCVACEEPDLGYATACIRVPCIIKAPGRIDFGSVCTHACSEMDLLPTIAAWAGVELQHQVDGVDISSCLEHKELRTTEIESVSFKLTPLTGIGSQKGFMRRDPSDIIKVGDTYYVWYSQHNNGSGASGYNASVWYATSKDGIDWEEKGEVVPRGGKGTWDEHSVFTPNVLVAEGKYYLYYTAVPEPFTGNNPTTPTALGMAVSDSPDGPWKKLEANPIMTISEDHNDFDSLRIDDACLIKRDGKYWMYYKGRQWNNTPRFTKMGVAIADQPEGPYVRHSAKPIIKGGHEVQVWPYGKGVMALIGTTGPKGVAKTLQYAEDGVTFKAVGNLKHVPHAAGFYRPEAFPDSGQGDLPLWGVEIGGKKGSLPFLIRFDYTWTVISK